MPHPCTDPATATATSPAPQSASQTFPFGLLGLLALTCFLTLLGEMLPSGMLIGIGADLGVSEGAAGQSVTAFALGCMVAAIPLTVLTAGIRRPTLIVALTATSATTAALTAMAPSLWTLLPVRFIAGLAAGLTWAGVPSYARSLVADRLAGRAIAVTAVGGTLSLAVGLPIGALAAASWGWRPTFWALALATGMLTLVLAARLPRTGAATGPGPIGQPVARMRQAVRAGFSDRRVLPVLAVVVCVMMAHASLYTYVEPMLAARPGPGVAAFLTVFGCCAVIGAGLVGWAVDQRLRTVVVVATGTVTAVGAALLGLDAPGWSLAAAAGWGLAFGTLAPALQTASAWAAGPRADQAQACLVTVWNLAIALGGVLGASVLDRLGARAVPLPALLLGAAATALVLAARTSFPQSRTAST